MLTHRTKSASFSLINQPKTKNPSSEQKAFLDGNWPKKTK
jgi:hypothetical protein